MLFQYIPQFQHKSLVFQSFGQRACGQGSCLQCVQVMIAAEDWICLNLFSGWGLIPKCPCERGEGQKVINYSTDLEKILLEIKKRGKLPEKIGPWVGVQGIDICVGTEGSEVCVEDNSTDRTFTLNQLTWSKLKPVFNCGPRHLKITRQFLCSLEESGTRHQSRWVKILDRKTFVAWLVFPTVAKFCQRPPQGGRKNTRLTFQGPFHGKISSSVSLKTQQALLQGPLFPIHWRQGEGWKKWYKIVIKWFEERALNW